MYIEICILTSCNSLRIEENNLPSTDDKKFTVIIVNCDFSFLKIDCNGKYTNSPERRIFLMYRKIITMQFLNKPKQHRSV